MSTSTQTGSRLVVAAAVVDSLEAPARLLCAARSYPEAHAGSYELPGGKVEPGERPEAALARELVEEIELQVRLGPEVGPTPDLAVAPPVGGAGAGGPQGRNRDGSDRLTQPGDDAPAWPAMHGYRMRVWLAEPVDPARPARCGTSHQSLDWVVLEEIGALPWLEADLPIVDALRARLGRKARDH